MSAPKPIAKPTASVRSRKGAPVIDLSKQNNSVAAEPTQHIQGRAPGTLGFLRGAFFGPPKTGKTVVSTSGKDVLLVQFDPEGDITSPLQGRQDITVVEPKNYKEILNIVRALATVDKDTFKDVAVDSLTFLFQLLGGKDLVDVYMAGKDVRRAYGKAGAAAAYIISEMVKLDMNVYFTAHLKHEDGEDAVPQDTSLGEHEVRLAVTPMVWGTLGPAVSFIGRTYKRVIQEETAKGKWNNVTSYHVSFNDGERSPAGARIDLPAELEISTHTLADLDKQLHKGGAS